MMPGFGLALIAVEHGLWKQRPARQRAPLAEHSPERIQSVSLRMTVRSTFRRTAGISIGEPRRHFGGVSLKSRMAELISRSSGRPSPRLVKGNVVLGGAAGIMDLE